MKKITLIKFKSLIFATCMSMIAQTSIAQIQKGDDIKNNYINSLSMPNTNTIAIGAPNEVYPKYGPNILTGCIEVHEWGTRNDGFGKWITGWGEKSSFKYKKTGFLYHPTGRIYGDSSGDKFGFSISMPDSITLAVGIPGDDGFYPKSKFPYGTDAGKVRVYNWKDTTWVQKGTDIYAEQMPQWRLDWGNLPDDKFGYCVSMPDANTVAIGAPDNDGTDYSAGHVRVYNWNGNKWLQKGTDIDGERRGDHSGYSISMPDSKTIAISAPDNQDNKVTGNNPGQVRVYYWKDTAWVQKGGDIDGKGSARISEPHLVVSMPDANTVAIGDWKNDINGTDAGNVIVYYWDGNVWRQKGSVICGKGKDDLLGYSVNMSDSNTIAIGTAGFIGRVEIYKWNGTSWIKKIDINQKLNDKQFGISVTLLDDNNIAIAGQDFARVYSSSSLDVLKFSFGNKIEIYPNPVKNILKVKGLTNFSYTIETLTGQSILDGNTNENINTELLPTGVYILNLSNQKFKFIKE